MRKSCEGENCTRHAYYGLPGGKPVYCALHKDVGYVNVHNKMCSRLGCYKRPHYGNPGGKAIYCVTHKDPAMVNIHGRRCSHEGCDKQPTFGRKGQKAMFCSGHRQADMVDVVYRRCEYSGGCEKHPHFGAEGEKARFCGRHKLEGMVNVKHRRCQQPGCRRERLFTEDSSSKPLYCSLHLAYQERGIDPRQCDLALPPGLTPIPDRPRRSGGVGGTTGGGMPGAGLLPGLGSGQGKKKVGLSMHQRLPSGDASLSIGRKHARSDEDGDDAGHELQLQMQRQQQIQVQMQIQQSHHQQQAAQQQRRSYDSRQQSRASDGIPPPSTHLPPANADYDVRPFLEPHEDLGGFPTLNYRGTSNSSAGFVDAPIFMPSRAPMSTVGGGNGSSTGLGGESTNIGSSGGHRPMVHPSTPLSSSPSTFSWSPPGRGSGAGANDGGNGAINSQGMGGMGGGSEPGGAGVEAKPPPTEPPVHGPLHQYGSRSGATSSLATGHGPSGSLATVRLPTLGWMSPASAAPLPGISNFRHLSAAAGVVLTEPGGSQRTWPNYESPPAPPPSQQQRSGGADHSGGQGQGQMWSPQHMSQGPPGQSGSSGAGMGGQDAQQQHQHHQHHQQHQQQPLSQDWASSSAGQQGLGFTSWNQLDNLGPGSLDGGAQMRSSQWGSLSQQHLSQGPDDSAPPPGRQQPISSTGGMRLPSSAGQGPHQMS